MPFMDVDAQSTYGSISGSVTDQSGAAVSGATVNLTNMGTSEKRTETSSDDGHFTFVNLFPGQYRIDIEKQGFKHFGRPGITVQVQQDTHIDAPLRLGRSPRRSKSTRMCPCCKRSPLRWDRSSNKRKANELPLNGRNIFNLITISPAAVAQGGSGGSPVGQNPFSWGNYQIGGSFANQGAEYLDGQPLNIGYINLPIIIPTPGFCRRIQSPNNNLGAEWGKFSGGIVNLSTKSGTNSWHGSAYEYFRNKVLNANEYFNKQVPISDGQRTKPRRGRRTSTGSNVGGPVFKNKTFFYVSWEQYRSANGITIYHHRSRSRQC